MADNPEEAGEIRRQDASTSTHEHRAVRCSSRPPHSHLYKSGSKTPEAAQQERRDDYLHRMKKRRQNAFESRRCVDYEPLPEDIIEALIADRPPAMSDIQFGELSLRPSEDPVEPSGSMEVSQEVKSSTFVPEMTKELAEKNEMRKLKLMESEWLIAVPPDLAEKWLCKLVPDGFRVLLIAKKRNTWLFTKRGRVLELKTFLPGGGYYDGTNGLTALDCIYDKSTKTIFVLDCLYWNKMSCLQAETTLRFYWLENQFRENPKLVETSKDHRLHLLKSFPADPSLIQVKIWERYILNIPLYQDSKCTEVIMQEHQVVHNGVAFYHNEYIYECGVKSPLFCWLYSYMVPEKLGVSVPSFLMAKMPIGYAGFDLYLNSLPYKEEKKFNRRRKKYWSDTNPPEEELSTQNMDVISDPFMEH